MIREILMAMKIRQPVWKQDSALETGSQSRAPTNHPAQCSGFRNGRQNPREGSAVLWSHSQLRTNPRLNPRSLEASRRHRPHLRHRSPGLAQSLALRKCELNKRMSRFLPPRPDAVQNTSSLRTIPVTVNTECLKDLLPFPFTF